MTFSVSPRHGTSTSFRLRACLRAFSLAFPASLLLLTTVPVLAQPAPPPAEAAPPHPAPDAPTPPATTEDQDPETPAPAPPPPDAPPEPSAPEAPEPSAPVAPAPSAPEASPSVALAPEPGPIAQRDSAPEALGEPAQATPTLARDEPVQGEPPQPEEAEGWPFEHFFDHFDVRGYAQLRFNNLVSTNERLVNLQGDQSMGGPSNFFFRRIRLVLSGELHPLIRAYFQPDFASAVSSDSQNLVQVRDWYFDLSEPSKQVWIRAGQSKVPYGFENLQSSQNRLPLDRSDAINSAAPNERDVGLFLNFAPTEIRRRFKYLVESGLKGSGNYGVVSFGVYNGQTANRPERNENKHIVGRVTYPFLIGSQILETGLSGYTGRFVIQKDENVLGDDTFRDTRLGAHLILYPQPIGIQVEYNIGKGPEFQALPPSADPDAPIGEVEEEFLHGGYAMLSLKLDNVIPYVRGMLYEGGKKHERNAPKYSVREIEMGIEWQPVEALELLGAYVFADRTFPEPPYPQEEGSLLRMQLQVNY